MEKIINKQNVLIFIACLIGVWIGYVTTTREDKKKEETVLSQIHSIREKDNKYKFINPLLAYDLPESKDFGEYLQLEQKLNDLVNSEKSQQNVDQVSVYFRGTQGHWVGINDTENYYPASLLKIVVMIAYYQQAQTNPDILNKNLIYTTSIQNQFTTSEFNTPSALKLNTDYKVDDLIHAMIIQSDNGATFTLLNSLDNKALDEVYSDLGLQPPKDSANYQISTKDYSLFFRILYNATYLNREYSDKALFLLSQTNFKDGLIAGMPSNVIIAHKFGEHVLTDSNGVQTGVELHDCGLVYTQKVFLLCVMTRGQKVENLEKTIADIARLVYNEAGNE
jgi:beta-lactamase class A